MTDSHNNAQERDVEDIRAAARGSRRALGTLYDRYGGLMLGVSLKVLKDRGDSEDLVHELFVEVWRHAGDYDPRKGSVKTWLFMRLRSRCLDWVRSARSRKQRLMTDDETAALGANASTGIAATHWPDRMVDHARVRDAVQTLPQSQREVVELGYFKGLSSSEISASLGIPIGTVKSRVRAAMNELRKAYEVDP